jgi:hypothetical protein
VTWFLFQISLHDGLPQQICYECLSRIELFHSYKQSCLESQYTLKHWNLFCEGGKLQVYINKINAKWETCFFVSKTTETEAVTILLCSVQILTRTPEVLVVFLSYTG